MPRCSSCATTKLDGTTIRHRIRHPDDARWAALELRRYAQAHGASLAQAWELATAVSELVSNVLKYAGEGEMLLSGMGSPRKALLVEVVDSGPGIEDLELAFEDGVSQGQRMTLPGLEKRKDGGRSLGHGLGAARRLVDELRAENRLQGGLRVLCVKYLDT